MDFILQKEVQNNRKSLLYDIAYEKSGSTLGFASLLTKYSGNNKQKFIDAFVDYSVNGLAHGNGFSVVNTLDITRATEKSGSYKPFSPKFYEFPKSTALNDSYSHNKLIDVNGDINSTGSITSLQSHNSSSNGLVFMFVGDPSRDSSENFPEDFSKNLYPFNLSQTPLEKYYKVHKKKPHSLYKVSRSVSNFQRKMPVCGNQFLFDHSKLKLKN
jgi:hypothetical protein